LVKETLVASAFADRFRINWRHVCRGQIKQSGRQDCDLHASPKTYCEGEIWLLFYEKKEFLSKKKQGISVTTGQFSAQNIKNCPKSYKHAKARFTLGVRADVRPKSSIPIGAKVEISPKGFTL
jgi:hypothetical protein